MVANNHLARSCADFPLVLGSGAFDLLDPARGFKILSVNSQNTNCILTSAAMPGRDYQAQFVNQLGGIWSNLLGGPNYAVPLATTLNFTDAPPAGMSQRYYRVQLLP